MLPLRHYKDILLNYIRKCFKNNVYPKILVIDTKGLLTNASKYNEAKPGEKINVFFITSNGKKHTLIFCYGTTIDKMLMKYIMNFSPEYMHTNGREFTFNGRQLKFGDQTPVEKYFNYYPNPIIKVFNE